MKLSIDTSTGSIIRSFDDKYKSPDEITSFLSELDSIKKKLLKIKSNSGLIEDVENYNPASLDTKTLLSDHRLSHSWSDMVFSGADFKYTLSQIKALHDKISKEMLSRGIVHKSPMELPKSALNHLIAYRRHMDKPIDAALFDAFDEFTLTQKKKRFSLHKGKSMNLRFEDISKNRLNCWTLEKLSYSGALIKSSFSGFLPISWLSAEARVLSQSREILVERGLYEPGADKPFFREFFIQGKILKGRHILRKMPSTGSFQDTGRFPFVWFFSKPKDQNPYILSSLALKKQDFPLGEKSSSWLPSELESQVPQDLVWWGKDITMEEASSLIQSAITLFKSKKLISDEIPAVPSNPRYSLISESEIEQIIDLSDPQLHLSRSQIADIVGCCGSTVYSWQRKSDVL